MPREFFHPHTVIHPLEADCPIKTLEDFKQYLPLVWAINYKSYCYCKITGRKNEFASVSAYIETDKNRFREEPYRTLMGEILEFSWEKVFRHWMEDTPLILKPNLL